LSLQLKDGLHSDEEDENTLDAVRSQISEMANKNLRTFPAAPYLLKISF
jgi:hypothetical protein